MYCVCEVFFGLCNFFFFFFFSSRRRHTRFDCDWSSDVCSSDLLNVGSTKPYLIYERTLLYRRCVFRLLFNQGCCNILRPGRRVTLWAPADRLGAKSYITRPFTPRPNPPIAPMLYWQHESPGNIGTFGRSTQGV